MADVHVEPHADGIGCDQIIDFARLVEFNLRVAGPGRQAAHHHRGTALVPPQHLRQRINILGGERDDGRALWQPRQLFRRAVTQCRKSWPPDNVRVRQQPPDERTQRFRSQQHRLRITAHVQQPVGEHVAAFQIRPGLRLIQRQERHLAVGRHRFRCAQKIAGGGWQDFLLTGDQGHLRRPLQLHHPVIDFTRQQTQREPDHTGSMAAHPLDRQMGLAGIGWPEHGSQRGWGKSGHAADPGYEPQPDKR